MSWDVACAGPVFLDLTFAGLEAIPRPGEERFASDLHYTAGGMANVAVGLARLGLRTALVSPVGRDAPGHFLRSVLARDGIHWSGPDVPRSPVTAILPGGGDRAMATYDPGGPLSPEHVAVLGAPALVANVAHVQLAAPGQATYALVGDADTQDGALEERVERASTLFANVDEAMRLTGARDGETAARRLAARFRTVAITLGPLGALAIEDDGEAVIVPAPAVAVRDTTGAGDLFAAAFVWADLRRLPLAERLRWAVLYASLSVSAATAQSGAVTLTALELAGRAAGLEPPGTPQPSVSEDSR